MGVNSNQLGVIALNVLIIVAEWVSIFYTYKILLYHALVLRVFPVEKVRSVNCICKLPFNIR